MRNGIVNVQQIQLMTFSHFCHARRQRETVRRILEQRISGDLHFVIEDAGSVRIQADRICVTDEMNFVPAIGELKPKFSRDDTAAAVSRITSDSNAHSVSRL